MLTKIYRVKGRLTLGSKNQIFVKEYKAICEDDVREKVYQIFGSKHRLKRNKIFIDEIVEISPDDVEDPILKELL